jgi:myo-inositol-1(or 4)-monophosphatase
MSREEDIKHIRGALKAAGELLLRMSIEGEQHGHSFERKADGQPVTKADTDADALLRERLPGPGEGWLSEESIDDRHRLRCERVWIVDPLDGTKEYLRNLPEWAISIALVENGEAVAGGIHNPRTGELFVGALGLGCFRDETACSISDQPSLEGATAVASRSEIRRGEWSSFDDGRFEVRPTGSVAYKIGLVACGLADFTWTMMPKSEWDVAAGVALIHAAGGVAWRPDDEPLRFNQRDTRIPGLIACPTQLEPEIRRLLGH